MFYPFDDYGETFLADEIDYNARHKPNDLTYKNIFPIWAKNINDKTELPSYKILKRKNYNKKYKLLWCAKALFDRTVWQDVSRLLKIKQFSIKNLIKTICFVGQGNFYAKQLCSDIKRNACKTDSIVLYAYWMHLQAYMAAKVKEQLGIEYDIVSVSRCHRFDVYEYAQNGFIPAREYILNKLDCVCPISDDAYSYILERYKVDSAKLLVSRLGTKDKGVRISQKSEVLRIVSCSWMRPIKRNSLILDAIENSEFPIEWVHIGDGSEFEHIKNRIEKLNNPNVHCKLLGRKDNAEVIEYYNQSDFDVFINVSESEGVPVSIMEAMAFGKIIVATDVGGTSEIVHNGVNGYLLPIDVTKEQIYEVLRSIMFLDSDTHNKMSNASRKLWENLSDEEKNYSDFWKLVLKEEG